MNSNSITGKVFSANQIRRWEEYTMQHTPVSALQLMEQAAKACVEHLEEMLPLDAPISVFCGPGNNGGDGLVIARNLQDLGFKVSAYTFKEEAGSIGYQESLKKFQKKKGTIRFLVPNQPLPELQQGIIIDAIFGIGLNKPIKGFYKKVVNYMNSLPLPVISIDMPSGLFADKSSQGNSVIFADVTLSLGTEKLAFFMPENSRFTGTVLPVDIGLLPAFAISEETPHRVIMPAVPNHLMKVRDRFSHKGTFGHACLIAGSYGMMGAAVLAAQGCLRGGVGKLTAITCEKGYDIMQTRAPEALCITSGVDYITSVSELSAFDVIGVGPGIGRHRAHKKLLQTVFATKKPLVVDADALNVLAENKDLISHLPEGSILTPHPAEFERLFGTTPNDFGQRKVALQMAQKHKVNIILKGGYTTIATPRNGIWFNTNTGNPGMATGGTGDVLTGILTALLAQQYAPEHACILGVYLHGLAGDYAEKSQSEEALIASDLPRFLGKAFKSVQQDAW